MNKSLVLFAVAAGLGFGVYPLFLNKSQLGGNLMAAVFTLMVFLIISPFAVSQIQTLASANWWMLSLAAVTSAAAMLCMTKYLAISPSAQVGTLIIFMVVVQALVAAVYDIWLDKSITLTKTAGFLCALAAIVLLNKK